MPDDVALVIKDPLLPATAIGNLATDFNVTVSTTGGGGGGGLFPPSPASFLQADAAANRNTNTQTSFFIHKLYILFILSVAVFPRSVSVLSLSKGCHVIANACGAGRIIQLAFKYSSIELPNDERTAILRLGSG